jgi:hypothetical protein
MADLPIMCALSPAALAVRKEGLLAPVAAQCKQRIQSKRGIASHYAFEDRDPLFILAFAVACALGSTCGFLQGAWPFGLVETVWAVVAFRRWRRARLPR